MSDITKTPREELECKKKYLYEHSMFWECNDGSKCQILEDDVCDLLNELNKEFEDCEKLLDSKDDFIHKFKRDIEELEISIKLFEDDIATKDKKIEEQQATIQRMKHSLNTIYKAFEKHYGYDMRNAVWLIDELSYDEIVDELYITETDSKNRKEASMYWKKKCDEQQATIRKLQDLCGESDSENAKLRIENKKLKEENEQLKNKLNKVL